MVLLKKSWEHQSGTTQRESKQEVEFHDGQLEEDNARDILQWIEYRNSHTSRGAKNSIFSNRRF
jgi:hypothetical protein